MKPFFTPEPVVFFNTQASKRFPGNTVEAIDDAFNSGADVICLNIQFSKDKVIMAISEPLIDTLCEGTGAVSSFTLNELKELNAGYSFIDENGEYPFRGKNLKFMTFEEVLQAFPGKRFNITIMNKDKKLVESYVSIIRKYDSAGRILTSTMYGKNIKLVRKLLPEGATAFTLQGILGVYALFKSGILFFIKGFTADAFQTPEAIGVSYLANGALIDQLHMIGIKVHVWNVKNRVQLKRVYSAGADGFMVDDIQMVKSFIEEKAI